ncbi:MAG: hypothetical protein OXG98_14970 [Gemmatimonadetes bacterium]|nr:hypothetical protein [Gemmatimonadota bacterium]
MDAPRTRTTSVWRTWLFNPFHFQAGGQALAWGLACIVGAAWLGGAFDYRYTGVLSFQLSTPTPIWLAIAQGLTAWAVPSVLLYMGGRQLSRSQVRAIDVFGTQALARAPGLLMALLVVSPPFRDLTNSLIYQGTSQFSIAQIAALIAAGTVTVLLLVWIVLLMYRGFAVSCNVAGGWAIAVFVVAIALGEVATGAAGQFLQGIFASRTVASVPVQSDQRILAEQLATRILQGHEQGRFEALAPEEATEDFRRGFTAEAQRQSHQTIRQLFGVFEGLDYVETRSMEDQPHLLIHRFKGRYGAASRPLEVRVVLDREGKLTGLWIKPWEDEMQ